MNRAPSFRDIWWPKHQRDCGGEYIKIKEPADYGKRKLKKEKKEDKIIAAKSQMSLSEFLSRDRNSNLQIPKSKEETAPTTNHSSNFIDLTED
jgi:hypothetical protein